MCTALVHLLHCRRFLQLCSLVLWVQAAARPFLESCGLVNLCTGWWICGRGKSKMSLARWVFHEHLVHRLAAIHTLCKQGGLEGASGKAGTGALGCAPAHICRAKYSVSQPFLICLFVSFCTAGIWHICATRRCNPFISASPKPVTPPFYAFACFPYEIKWHPHMFYGRLFWRQSVSLLLPPLTLIFTFSFSPKENICLHCYLWARSFPQVWRCWKKN